MTIKAKVKLSYTRGFCLLEDEGLSAKIKFREQGRLFKTTLDEKLLVYDPHRQYSGEDVHFLYSKYLSKLTSLSQNPDEIRRRVEWIIKEHIQKSQKTNKKKSELDQILENFNKMKKFEIEVKIKEGNK